MKKTNFKKVLSVFLTILMVMSCWVFVPGEHKIEVEAADYGMGTANNTINRSEIKYECVTDGTDYATMNYPNKIYLDKTETLQSAGYKIYLKGHYGSGTNYNTWFSCNAWGGVSTSTSSDIKDKRMQSYFSNFNYSVTDGVLLSSGKYTNKNFDNGNTYLVCFTGGDFSATVNLEGTPNGTYNGSVFDADNSNNSNQPLLLGMRKGTSWKGRVWLNSGSDYSGDIYMQIYVYDKAALNTAINTAKTCIADTRYTLSSRNALQSVVNSNSSVLTTREVTQTQIDAAAKAINDQIAKLELRLIFDNLFNFGTFTIDESNLTLNERTDDGFTVTSKSGTDANTGFSYEMPVEPGKTYVFSADVEFTQASGGYDMYVHTLDENKAGETTATPDTSNGAHREGNVYISLTGQTTNKTPYIRFTAGENTRYIRIRFDANAEGNKLKVSNIKVMPDGVSYIAPKTYTKGQLLGATLSVPTRTGYTFNGWYLADGTPVSEANGTVVSSLQSFPMDNTYTLISTWKVNQYTITFDTDGGSTIAPITQDYGSAITAPANPTKTDYKFVGWDKTIPSTMPAENITIKAQWALDKFTVEFVNYDGTVLQSGDFKGGATPSYTGATPTKAYDATNHYTFSGWSPAVSAVTGDVTYTAQFTATAHTFGAPAYNDQDTHESKCSCGYIVYEAHSLEKQVTSSKEPTCNAEGYKEYGKYCPDCNSIYGSGRDTLPATGEHNLVTLEAVAATCTTTGLTEGKKCKDCGIVTVAQETTPELGHSFTNYVSNNDATCLVDGTKTAKCDRCDAIDTVTDEDSALDHSFTNYVSNNDATCLVDGTKTAKCDRCDVTDTVTDEGSALEHDYEAVVTAPTCTEQGYTTHTCSKCGDSYRDTYVDALNHVWSETYTMESDGKDGKHYQTCTRENCNAKNEAVAHTWGEGVENPEADCENAGTMTYTCTAVGCGATYAETVNPDGHNYGEWIKEVPAICNKTGVKGHYECSACGKYFEADKTTVITDLTIEIAPNNHNWVKGATVAPTCTAKGYTEYKCSYCGNEKSADIVEKVPHTPAEAVKENEKASSCTVAGSYDSVVYCSECNNKLSSEIITLPLAAHTPAEAVKENEVAGTCITAEKWNEVTYCSECRTKLNSVAKTGSIDENNHKTTTECEKTDATCLTVGYTAGTFCEDCNKWISGHEEIPAIAHKNKVHHEKIDATCVAEGTIEYWSCPDCSKNFSDEACTVEVTDLTIEIDENNHDLNKEEAKAPTCTEKGWDAYEKCSRCNYTTKVEKDALDHDRVSHEAKAPTCTDKGWDAYETCQREGCNYTTYVEKAKLGHNYKNEWTASSVEAGKHYRDCTRCGEAGREKVDCTESAAVEENRKEATCTVVGSYDSVVYCSVCDAKLSSKTITLPLAEHTPGEAVVEKFVDSTCYAEGSYDSVVYCSAEACKYEISRTTETIEKKAHTAGEAVVENKVDSTCYAEGSYDEVVYCSVEACKAELSRTPKTIAEKDHTPAEAVVENRNDSTCYAEGSYDEVVYCSVEACKAELSRTTETIEKKAHTAGEAVVENKVDSSCYAEGSYDEVVYCSIEACKAELSRTKKTIEKKAHTPAAAVVENEVDSTCYAEGSYDSVVYCSVEDCKYEISRTPKTIAKKAHTAGEAVVENVDAADCENAGSYDSVVYCSVCAAADKKEELSRVTTTVPATGHKMQLTSAKVEPKCEVAGKEAVYTCANGCGRVAGGEAIAALEHNMQLSAAKVEPECEVEGREEVYTCANGCGTTTGGTVIPALIHKDDDGDSYCDLCEIVLTSCKHEGTPKQYTTNLGPDGKLNSHKVKCLECGYVIKVENCDFYIEVIAPTCYAEGYSAYTCKDCTYTFITDKTDMVEHDFGEWVSNDANCNEIQSRSRRCKDTRCLYKETEKVFDETTGKYAYGPHSLVVVPGKAATCTKAGYTAYSICVNCEVVTESTIIPAKGHTDANDDGNCDTCNYLMSSEGECGCYCHGDSFIDKLIYKIARFFWKLFKINANCQCGAKHW